MRNSFSEALAGGTAIVCSYRYDMYSEKYFSIKHFCKSCVFMQLVIINVLYFRINLPFLVYVLNIDTKWTFIMSINIVCSFICDM